MLLLLLAALALRLSVWPRVFSGGRVYLDGPDGYYHLRRAEMTLLHWPRVPQFDPALNYPAGGRISWTPMFDGLLATIALPWRSDHALEVAGAVLPPILGVLQLGVLYLLIDALRGRRAAMIAVIIVAILPAVVRYTLLGALDHDPFYILCLLLALLGLTRGSPLLVAVGLTCSILGWSGAIVEVAIVTAVAIAIRGAASRALAIGASVSAILILPFVMASPWHGATFEGLSWLHVAALAGAGAIGAAFARQRRLLVIDAIACFALLPISIRPFITGAEYAAGDAPILAMVAEAQPLLRLFGRLDFWPVVIRFGLLPLLAIALLPLFLRRDRARDLLFVTPWLVITFTLALLHSRFSFDAGIALGAFGGIALDRLTRPAMIATIAMLPIIPAYVPLPGLQAFNFYLRPNALRDYEMDGICSWLRGQPEGAVLAPWSFGHWIVWIAKKPVVISPMLSVGQSEFADGLRFFFLTDETTALQFLHAHGVRYLIVTPEIDSIVPRARVAGLNPAPFRDPRVYAQTIAARLTFGGPFDGYREVLRSRAMFGRIPLVRVYEIQGSTRSSSAPARKPSSSPIVRAMSVGAAGPS